RIQFRGLPMAFAKQIEVYKRVLASDDLSDAERVRVEAHVARLKSYDELEALAGNDTEFFRGDSQRQNGDGFRGQQAARVIKSMCVSALDHVPFSVAAEKIYGKAVGSLLTKTANPVDSSDAAGLIGPAIQDLIDLIRPGSV